MNSMPVWVTSQPTPTPSNQRRPSSSPCSVRPLSCSSLSPISSASLLLMLISCTDQKRSQPQLKMTTSQRNQRNLRNQRSLRNLRSPSHQRMMPPQKKSEYSDYNSLLNEQSSGKQSYPIMPKMILDTKQL